jgi:hypothetical protein
MSDFKKSKVVVLGPDGEGAYRTGGVTFDDSDADIGSVIFDESAARQPRQLGTQGVLTSRPENSWMTHDLKTWPEGFQAVVEGRKVHETRTDDRHFQVGDELLLREWIPPVDYGCKIKDCALCTLEAALSGAGYTGRYVRAAVTYVSRGSTPFPKQHLTPGSVVLSIRVLEVRS